jgi:uncharacterized protein YkwD
MNALRFPSVRLILSAIVLLGIHEAAADPPGSESIDLSALLAAHNRERAKTELPPLVFNPKLEAAALAHAKDMAKHDKMSHEGSDGSTVVQRIERQDYHYRAIGENVAAGQESVDEVMRTWMDSPPHKKNILSDVSEMGAACVESEDGTPYWCVDFGKPWPVLDPATVETEVIKQINEARKKDEKSPLKVNAKLHAAAQRYTKALADRDPPDFKDDSLPNPFDDLQKARYRYAKAGMLVSSGQPTPEDLVKNWLEERSNRETLQGAFDQVGVGYATTKKGIPYWSLIIAKSR